MRSCLIGISHAGKIICAVVVGFVAWLRTNSLKAGHVAMKLYPIFVSLTPRAVLVVGGGALMERKVEALLTAQARVTVNAAALTPRLPRWVSEGRITHRTDPFQEYWLARAWLVVAATSDRETNMLVATMSELRQMFVNVVDDSEPSSFHVPTAIDRPPLTIGSSSGGEAPTLARLLRERLETRFDHAPGGLATLAARLRGRIAMRMRQMAAWRRNYEQLFLGPVVALLRQGRPAEAQVATEKTLAVAPLISTGALVLVGAGPDDPGLLTLRALRASNEGDVILHDRLVSAELLDLARRDAERIEVGKQAGHHHTTQAGIGALLLEHACAGNRVVRLKGGGPFVFGRGGEELDVPRQHGIPCEVVPGITAAEACAAYAGVSLTHRDHAQSVRFVTAHRHSSGDTQDWAALAQERQTLAVHMGVTELATLQTRLLEHGRAGSTPVALIENGSRPELRVITGTLGSLAYRARRHGVASPALLIVGKVAALASFGQPPVGAVVHTIRPLAKRPRKTPLSAPVLPFAGNDVLLAIYCA